jgi:hypothetical protein
VVAVLLANVAVRFLVPSTTKAQFPVPVQAPLQPEKVEPEAGVAEKARLVPLATLALQVLPQLMALGLDEIVPVPVPALAAVTV